jgi:purine-binding chemotaxis protein CheW
MSNRATDGEKIRILKKRARELAREPIVQEKAAEEGSKFLEFIIGLEHYAIEAACVREVYPLKRITPLPCTPGFVLGIVNLRGQIFSVLDIHEMVGLESSSRSESAKVVVIFSDEMEVAIVVDDVLGVRTISVNDITEDLSFAQTQGLEFVSGVTRDRTALIDARRLLLAESIIVNEEVK